MSHQIPSGQEHAFIIRVPRESSERKLDSGTKKDRITDSRRFHPNVSARSQSRYLRLLNARSVRASKGVPNNV